MKLKFKPRFAPEVATSSMNDIMFFLLLFFLIVATVSNPSVIRLLLPSTKSAQMMSKKTAVLSVTEERKYYLDDKPLDFNQIEPRLAEARKSAEDFSVIVRADKSLTLQDLVNVLEIGARLNVKLVLATEKN